MLRFFRRTAYMGWFGKLPSVGDFVGRGLHPVLRETCYAWTSSGMAAFAHAHPEDWQDLYALSPVWHFFIGAGLWDKPALLGCLAPSLDKIGRRSALVVLRSLDRRKVHSMLPPDNRWQHRVDMTLRQAIGEQLPVGEVESQLLRLSEGDKSGTASILNDLGIDGAQEKDWFDWPALHTLVEERRGHSFWWAPPSDDGPRRIIHAGRPDERLFCMLMEGACHE